MGKKGQALVLFIIIIPIFLVVSAVLVDMGINKQNEKKLKNVSSDIMEVLLDDESLKDVTYENRKEVTNNLKKQAERLYDANDLETEFLYVELTYGDKIILTNSMSHYSFLNSLFGKGNGNREITVTITGYISDGKKIIEFEDDSNED